jgi:hypothetical protein
MALIIINIMFIADMFLDIGLTDIGTEHVEFVGEDKITISIS